MSTTPILESIHDRNRGQLKVKAQAAGEGNAEGETDGPTEDSHPSN